MTSGDTIGMQDLRALLPFDELVSLLDYWCARVDDTGRMLRTRLDPADLAPVLPYIFILDVIHDPTKAGVMDGAYRFRYRLCGTVIQDAMGRRVIGEMVDEVREGPVAKHMALLFGCAAHERVAGYGISNLVGESSTIATYHRLCLPMSTDGQRVDQLLGGWIPTYENPVHDPRLRPQWPDPSERPGNLFFASPHERPQNTPDGD